MVRKAVDSKNPYAMTQLANNYMNGYIVEKDYKKAVALFREAALLDTPEAAFNLGYMHTIGLGVPMDNKEAVFWYDKLSLDQAAQVNLDLCIY